VKNPHKLGGPEGGRETAGDKKTEVRRDKAVQAEPRGKKRKK